MSLWTGLLPVYQRPIREEGAASRLPGAALPASRSPDLEGPSLGVRRQLRLRTFETFGIFAEPNKKEASTAGEVCDVSFYPQELFVSFHVLHR